MKTISHLSILQLTSIIISTKKYPLRTVAACCSTSRARKEHKSKKQQNSRSLRVLLQILPDEINESEGYIVSNRDCDKQIIKALLQQQQRSPNTIYRFIRRSDRRDSTFALIPFVLKESNI